MTKTFTLGVFSAFALMSIQSACALPPDCPGPNQLLLHVAKYELGLNEKKPICVTTPGNFKIKIVGPRNQGVSIQAGDAVVEGKKCDGLEIAGDNSADKNKITVEVVGNAAINYECEFWIKVDGIGMLDPKVRVVDNETIMNLQYVSLHDFLDTLDISLEEANKLRPPPDAED